MCARDLEERADLRPALVVLPGRVQEPRRPPERHRSAGAGGEQGAQPPGVGVGQDVWVATAGFEAELGPLPHLLKVFLLDRRGSVREIYTTSFLQPQMVLNDIETLLLEDGTRLD